MTCNTLSGGERLTSRLMPRGGYARRLLPAVVVLLSICGAGCEPRVSVYGLVTNIEGEPLPGVSVKAEAAQSFGVSNGNGLYGKRPNPISVPPGKWELTYIKSGFTSARQTIEVPDGGSVDVTPVALWPLPASKGVFVLDHLNYLPLTRVTPEPYRGVDGAAVFAIKQSPELMLDAAPDYLISHKMANYDWELTRLEQTQVIRPGVEVDTASGSVDPAYTETVWSASVRLPIDALAVDLPEQLLWQIRPAAAMPPGVYALHWGALDGDATTEESVYLLEIRDPLAAVEAETADPAAAPEGG